MPPKRRKARLKEILQKGNETIKRKSRSKRAIQKQQQREKKRWMDLRDTFRVMIPTLENRRGRVRTYKENRMVILALYASLNRHESSMLDSHHNSVSWRAIEEEVSKDFHVRLNHVIDLQQAFFDSGHVIVINYQA